MAVKPVFEGQGGEVEELPGPVDEVGEQHPEVRNSVHDDVRLLRSNSCQDIEKSVELTSEKRRRFFRTE